MSEQEKSGGGTDPSMVLVEQPMAEKQAFHPIEMQEDIQQEKHRKMTNAPAIPSTIEVNESRDTKMKEKIGSELAMSSEKLKRNVIKKVSSINRRGSSPETIMLGSITDVKPSATTKPQPIPAHISMTDVDSGLATSKDDEKVEDEDDEKKEEEDSITEEIADLRTPAMHKISSEWATKKKEVSWNDNDYLKKVKVEELGAKSQFNVLERKSSVGPCYRAAAPFGRPSGISLCLAKTPVYNTEVDVYNPKISVINITLSKKCLLNRTVYRAESEFEYPHPVDDQNKKTKDVPKVQFLGVLRKKIANMSGKIRNVFV